MSLKARGVLIVVCVLCGSLGLLGAGPGAAAPAVPGGEPATVVARSMLVEAFVVEVNLPALARQGVSPIGRQPHAVTVANILKCLDDGQARVHGGSKVATRAQFGAEVDAKKTIYVRKTAPQASYNPYDSGASLRVTIDSAREGAVACKYSFSAARFAEKRPDLDVPPATEHWEWSGVVTLRFGEPQIAGGTQNGETAVFLLLVANEQGE
jgi:hypothetical protein